MATQSFYNMNLAVWNDTTAIPDSEHYLNKTNYGVVWSLEFGYSASTKPWGNNPITTGNIFTGVGTYASRVVIGSDTTWNNYNYDIWIDIILSDNYQFPDNIIDILRFDFRAGDDGTTSGSINSETSYSLLKKITGVCITPTLIAPNKLRISLNPSRSSVNSYIVQSAARAFLLLVRTWPTGGQPNGLPFEEAGPTGFHGDTNTIKTNIYPPLSPSYEDGERVSFQLNDESGYHTFTTPTVNMGTETINFNLIDGVWKVEFDVTDNFVINATATRAIKIIYGNVRGCTVNKSDNTFYDITSLPFQIKATPKDRYIWQAGVSIAYCEVGYTGNYRRQQFGFSGEPTHADYAQLRFYSFEDTDVEIKLYLEPDYSYEKLGLIGIYSPTDNQMLELANKRFIDSPASEEFGFIDYSEFIISYRKLYLKRSVITNYIQKTVKYGKYNTGITCDLIPDTIINIPVDTLTIREMYNNVLDYDATTITAYLPFIGFVDLDVQTFMGATTSLTYRVNPISGDCVAIFEASRTQQTTQAAFTGNIGFGIPVHFNGTSYRNNDITDNVWYLMNNLIPYIDIRTQLPYEPVNNIFGGDDNTLAQISTFTGYCRFSKVDLSMGAMTQDEYNEIINILQSGVIL